MLVLPNIRKDVSSLLQQNRPSCCPHSPGGVVPFTTGDQGYVSPLIDLYRDWDSDLQALYHSPSDWASDSYEGLKEAPAGYETDRANSESLRTEEQTIIERHWVQSDST